MNKSNKNIFLYGFMGCGKTTAGKIIADNLNIDFFDTDKQVEEKENLTITEIFAKYNEQYFRKLETTAITQLCEAHSNSIIALGGGAATIPLNIKIIKEHGALVFIDTNFEICYERIKDDKSRPLAKTRASMRELFSKRRSIYLENAAHTINGNTDIHTIAEGIIEIYANL